jgi:hypothetical protein
MILNGEYDKQVSFASTAFCVCIFAVIYSGNGVDGLFNIAQVDKLASILGGQCGDHGHVYAQPDTCGLVG